MHEKIARTCLLELGMNESEIKIYLTLTQLKIASPRELCELTEIPRTKVYSILNSLEKYGYITKTGEEPSRYKIKNIDTVLKNLKKYYFKVFGDLGNELNTISKEKKNELTSIYTITNSWAVDKQIKLIIERAKTELIVICRNPEFYEQYKNELKKANKRISLYLITSDKNTPKIDGLNYYYPGKDVAEEFINSNQKQKSGRGVMEVIIRDATEELTVFKKDDTTEAAIITNSIYARYISRITATSAEKIE